jgi:hypothetical protein
MIIDRISDLFQLEASRRETGIVEDAMGNEDGKRNSKRSGVR